MSFFCCTIFYNLSSLKNHTVNVRADSHSGETEITNNLKNSKDNTLTITSDLGDIYIE